MFLSFPASSCAAVSLAEGKALFFELGNGAFQIRCLHGDVTVFAVKRRLHALEIRPGELGLLPVARREIEHAGQKLRERERFFGVFGVDADMCESKRVFHRLASNLIRRVSFHALNYVLLRSTLLSFNAFVLKALRLLCKVCNYSVNDFS